MKKYYIILCLLFVSCGQDLENGAPGCQLTNNSGNIISCLIFDKNEETSEAETLCDNIQNSNALYEGSSFGTGASDCPTANRLGTCSLSQGSMIYFSTDSSFNAGSAESDCNSAPQSGSWSAI
jgi:hypothetical protein